MFALVTLLVASAAVTPQPSATPFPADAAVIVNSGSTNIAGYKIVVRPGGAATVVIDGAPDRDQQLSAATSGAFFKDLAAATPLSGLAAQPCMKSASFGSRTTIEYKGERSPDISCPMTGIGQSLGADVERITSELHVLPSSRFLRRTLTAPDASPSPKPSD
jgi:hypothetical protein